MAFLLKPAVREKINLLFAIAGPSGSGKTYSALLLAQGIAGDNGKIAVIDTEAGRSLQYAPKNGEIANPQKGTFNFLHLNFEPPFSPERYTDAIKECEKVGASVIVIDSASHEWNGEGGVSEIAEQNALAKATDKQTGEVIFTKLESVKLLSWAEPKKQHKRMMSKLTQIKSHIIFCLRAEDKVKMVRQDYKTTIQAMGFQPICEKGFMFEMTASLTMDPINPGKPNYDLEKKLNNDMQAIFKNNEFITIEHGRRLKQWAETGDTNIPVIKKNNITNGTIQSPQPTKSKLEMNYERLLKKISEVKDSATLEQITGHPEVIQIRAELAEKEPQWAGVINNLVKQALHTFEVQEEAVNVI